METDFEIALTKEIADILKRAYDITGGSCGISANVIIGATGENWKTLHPILKNMQSQKLFKVRKGINGILFFYNQN